VWDGFVKDLRDRGSHVRAIAAQLLCGLARSDPQNRMLKDINTLMVVMRDERFVTLSAIALKGRGRGQEPAEDGGGSACRPVRRLRCREELLLIRHDIVQGMRNLSDDVRDETIRTKELELIETGLDLKYSKKYAGVWKAR